MRRPLVGTLFALAACLIITYPSSATAIPIHRHVVVKPTGLIPALKGTYVVHVAPKDGDEDGVANVKDDCPKTSGPDNGCPPPKPEPVPASSSAEGIAVPTPVATTVAPAPVSSGGCPSYMAAEADSPSDVNPTSGAAGCFQILPSTQAAHGCADVGPECAAIICATEGPGAWAASGANPCPYVQP